jgi:hypothetical protein
MNNRNATTIECTNNHDANKYVRPLFRRGRELKLLT